MRTNLLSRKVEKNLRNVEQSFKYAPSGTAFLLLVYSLLLVSTPHNASLLIDFAFVCSMGVIGFMMGSLGVLLLQVTLAVVKVFDCAEHPVPSCVIFSALPLSFASEVLPVPFSPPRFCLANREAI